MKKILLSIKPSVYMKILSGKKIYEHRRAFPNENIIAYMYISRPIQQISGILYLENRVTLEEWKHQYEYDPLAISRIEEYMTKYKVAMEIQQFQETTSIPLSRIKKDFPDFLVPQMYYYIDNHPILGYIENSIAPVGKPIIHSFDNISSNDICVH